MSTVMTDGAGAIRIVLGGGGTARLFGVPFLLAGAWLGHHLILGLFQLVTGTSGLEMIPGTILLLIMTAAFLLPGWARLVARAVVEIDRARGIVTIVRDLRFYQHRHERKLSEFSTIEVDLLSTAPNKRNSRAFQVELTAATRQNQVIGLFDDADEALRHGQHLSGLLGLPLQDHRYVDRPPRRSIRSPSPAAERRHGSPHRSDRRTPRGADPHDPSSAT